METLECILTRRSIRKFKNQPVEWYLIGQVLNAGFNAPSAGNLQDFRFLVVTDPEKKNQLAQAGLNQQWMAQAPVIILILSEYTKTKRQFGIRGERLYTIQSCAAATQNILLAAHSLGLAGCWVGAFDEDKVSAIIGIPDYARPQAMIPIGFADEEPPVPPKFKLENLVFLNRYGDNAAKVWNIHTEALKDWAPHVQGAIDGTISKFRNANQTLGDAISTKTRELSERIKSKFKKGDK